MQRENFLLGNWEQEKECLLSCPTWEECKLVFGGAQSSPCWSLTHLNCDWFLEHILILQNYFGLGFVIQGLPHFLKKRMHKLLLNSLFGVRVGCWGSGRETLNKHPVVSLLPLAFLHNQPWSLSSLAVQPLSPPPSSQSLCASPPTPLRISSKTCGLKGCTW